MIRRNLLLLLAGLALLLAACTSEGLPASYSDQDNRAETQFVNACEDSLDGAENPGEGYCQCAFYTVAQELTFEEFLELDQTLRDDPGNLKTAERELLESVSLPCQYDSGDINNG